jgi:hypothetical protein
MNKMMINTVIIKIMKEVTINTQPEWYRTDKKKKKKKDRIYKSIPALNNQVEQQVLQSLDST